MPFSASLDMSICPKGPRSSASTCSRPGERERDVQQRELLDHAAHDGRRGQRHVLDASLHGAELLRLAADRAAAQLLHLDRAAALGSEDLAELLRAERDGVARLHDVAEAQGGSLRMRD